MTLPFLHSPADVMRKLLINAGYMSDPIVVTPTPTSWPGYKDAEPDKPDNVVTTYDTEPQLDAHGQVTGQSFQHWGVQVRVRGTTHAVGFGKADAIRVVLNEGQVDSTVSFSSTSDGGAATYLVHSSAQNTVRRMGMDSPTTKRHLFTINCLATIKRVA